MASWKQALDTVINRDEGGYVYSFNAKDTGGGTYAGIARNKWPTWEGWLIVDNLKPDKVKLATDATLLQKVDRFYYVNFLGTYIEGIRDQDVATKFLSMCVNFDTHEATMLLQRSINYLRGDSKLAVDGTFGATTKLWLNDLISSGMSDKLLVELRARSAWLYSELLKSKPVDDEEFILGWCRRAVR